MSTGLIGKKLGMTSVFDESGAQYPVTVIEAVPNVVTHVKSVESDGYSAVQLATGDRKVKRTSKAMQGHFGRAGTAPKRMVREFRDFDGEVELGGEVKIEDLLSEGDIVDVTGTSKGKGFQGVIRRHNFAGVGGRTHGQHNRDRAPGSIGASSTPSRVFKGMRMGGQMGSSRVTMKNLTIVQIIADKNLVLIKGAVPGPTNSFVSIRRVDKN